MIKDKNKTLVISPHPDDGILGCGATIMRLTGEQTNVYYAVFSVTDFEASPHSALTENSAMFAKSLLELGIPEQQISLFNFTTRNFYKYRQEILESLISLRQLIQPQQVFMPSSTSIHQDHCVVYEEGLRAFKHITCYGYDLPWDAINFETSCFFKVEETHINQKIKALQFMNQSSTNKYANDSFIGGLARVRGTQINTDFAEAFEVLRTVM